MSLTICLLELLDHPEYLDGRDNVCGLYPHTATFWYGMLLAQPFVDILYVQYERLKKSNSTCLQTFGSYALHPSNG